MKSKSNKTEATTLREKAIALLKTKQLKSSSEISLDEMRILIHELEVHQIELELQNEELLTAKSVAQKSSGKYIVLYDFSPSGYFTLSKEGEIIELNPHGANMLGKERLKLMSSQFGFFLSDDTKPVFNQFIRKVFDTKVKETCEVTLSINDCAPIYVYLTGIAIENGKQCIVNAIDITLHKQVEGALTREQYLMNAMMNNLPDHIYFKDKESRFIRINDAMARLLGLSAPGEAIGKTDFDFFSEEHARQAYEDEQAIIQTGKPLIKEEKETWSDRPDTWVSTIKLPLLSHEGNIVGTFGISRDITGRIQADMLILGKNKEIAVQNEELQQINEELNVTNNELVGAKDKAEENDRLKSAFLANMSHEIRTPMNGILGFADLLKEPDLSGEERQEYIGIIEKSGLRMLHIINDLIDISKVESGMMEVNISESNINEQIVYIYTFFKPEVERKGMQLSYEISLPSIESIIKTDREKIFAILTNLVKNSIKYSDTGTIELGYHLKNKYLEFYVKDTGIGIPHDKKEAIFDRFVQADVYDKRAFQGAGLGLAISKAYVKMLGGNIWVESFEGKGSTFYFTIPYNAIPDEQNSMKKVDSKNKKEHSIKNLKILIADDDESSEKLLTEILKNYCREEIHVNNGLQAVQTSLHNPDIDLILMDIKLPDMNGYEATREIRKFNEKVLIIAQTAYALTGDSELAIKAGCNEYVSKPIDKKILIEIIHKYF